MRKKLRELLAFPKVPQQPTPRLVSESPRDGYLLQRWELYPEPSCVVPFLLLVPRAASATQPAPGVLCFPESDQPKEALCGEPWEGAWQNRFGEREFMAKQFVRANFVALALDNPGTASLADPRNRGRARNAEHLIWLGRSYEGLSVFQKLVALDWLKSLPFVDARHIATCGHSIGAKPALLLGVLDPTIRAVIWNDIAIDWRMRDVATNLSAVSPWHYVPAFIRWFDYTDLMAALAPTPLLITEGGRLDDHVRIRKAYALLRSSKSFKVTFMPHFKDMKRRCLTKIPEGIGAEECRNYANYDDDHYFKAEIAVPWLCEIFEKNVSLGCRTHNGQDFSGEMKHEDH